MSVTELILRRSQTCSQDVRAAFPTGKASRRCVNHEAIYSNIYAYYL